MPGGMIIRVGEGAGGGGENPHAPHLPDASNRFLSAARPPGCLGRPPASLDWLIPLPNPCRPMCRGNDLNPQVFRPTSLKPWPNPYRGR